MKVEPFGKYTLQMAAKDSQRNVEKWHDLHFEKITGSVAYNIHSVSLGDLLMCVAIIGLFSLNGLYA